jgi:hypothetical protein
MTGDSALSDLCDAYEHELREAGVLMPGFGEWMSRVSRGVEPRTRAGAIAALQEDLRIARDHDSSQDGRLLAEWIERLDEDPLTRPADR